MCRLASGHLVAAPVLLDPLHELVLDRAASRFAFRGDRSRPVTDRRAGASPSMLALAEAGLSTTDVAVKLGVGNPTVWRWLNGVAPASPALAPALEQLIGDPQLACEIIELIPRNGRSADRPSAVR
jgi:DNA-binding transcriptional regulator YdaS (Cro superfamily)